MSRAAILSPEEMKKEIAASHERSRRYGISREERNPDQERLSTAALEQTHSNIAATAKLLGISRATLYRKVKQFDFLPKVRN
jgi:transcriptional regulator of acetoin/glycerol metabolism